MNNTEKEGYSEKEKKIEKWSKEWIINCVTQAKGKKDTYIILLLIGILLFSSKQIGKVMDYSATIMGSIIIILLIIFG